MPDSRGDDQSSYDADGFGILEKSRSGHTLWAGTEKGKIYRNVLPVPVGTGEAGLSTEPVMVYPNPCHNFIRIRNVRGGEVQCAEVFNLSGKMVMSIRNPGTNAVVDLSGLTDGIYILRVFTGKEFRYFRLIRTT